jgi:hypothetical protein
MEITDVPGDPERGMTLLPADKVQFVEIEPKCSIARISLRDLRPSASPMSNGDLMPIETLLVEFFSVRSNSNGEGLKR